MYVHMKRDGADRTSANYKSEATLVKGDPERNYLYWSWEWEGDMYVRKEIAEAEK